MSRKEMQHTLYFHLFEKTFCCVSLDLLKDSLFFWVFFFVVFYALLPNSFMLVYMNLLPYAESKTVSIRSLARTE